MVLAMIPKIMPTLYKLLHTIWMIRYPASFWYNKGIKKGGILLWWHKKQILFNTYMESKAWFTNPRSLSSSISTTLSSWSSNFFFSSIGNFLSLNAKKPVQNRLYLSNLNGLFRQAFFGKNITFFFPPFLIFTTQTSSYFILNPYGWQFWKIWIGDKKSFSLTKSVLHAIFRWQICHRNCHFYMKKAAMIF